MAAILYATRHTSYSGAYATNSTALVTGTSTSTSYYYTYASDGYYIETKEPEPVNLTDWAGLSRWYRGFSGISVSKNAFRIRKIPEYDSRNKMRLEVQKMRHEI